MSSRKAVTVAETFNATDLQLDTFGSDPLHEKEEQLSLPLDARALPLDVCIQEMVKCWAMLDPRMQCMSVLRAVK